MAGLLSKACDRNNHRNDNALSERQNAFADLMGCK